MYRHRDWQVREVRGRHDPYAYLYVYMNIYTYIHIYIYTHIYIYLNLYVYMYIYVLPQGLAGAGMNSEDAMIHGTLDPGRPATVFVYSYVCAYIYRHIYTNRKREREKMP